MNKLGGILLIVGAIAWLVMGQVSLGPGIPVDLPESVQVPDLVSNTLKEGFKNKKSEAATWAGLLSGLARVIEQDADHPKTPRLSTMSDVDSLRKWVVSAPPVPVDGGQVIGQALGKELEALGTGTEPLDADGRRQKVVQLFDGAAYVLQEVAK